MKLPITIIAFLCIISCNTERNNSLSVVTDILNTDILAKQSFKIINSKSQTIITRSGSIIKIPANAFSGNRELIELEIVEAFSAEDIVLANLHTQSNGEAMQSGGMIKLSTKDKSLKLKKRIEVHIPKKNFTPKMSTYVGEESEDGINWINPKPIMKEEEVSRFEKGQILFTSNCSSCHDPLQDGTGPPLAGVSERRPTEWIYQFVRNSAALIASEDVYANCIYNFWNKTAMTAFPTLSDEEIDEIMYYADQQASSNPIRALELAQPHPCDSCEIHNNLMFDIISSIDSQLNEINNEYIKKEKIILDNIVKVPESRTVSIPKEINKEYYYSFELGELNWFNIDVLLKDIYRNLPFQLNIKLATDYDKRQVSLIVPQLLLNARGDYDREANNWFGSDLGMPRGLKCFLVLIGTKADKFFLDVKEFESKANQSIILKGVEVNKEEIKSRIKKLNLNSYELSDATKERLRKEQIANTNNVSSSNTLVSVLLNPLNSNQNQLLNLRMSTTKARNELFKKQDERLEMIKRFLPKSCECISNMSQTNAVIEDINISSGANASDYE